MSENMKRLLTFLVAVSLVFSMMPMTVLADSSETLEPEESVGPRDPAMSGGTTTPTEPAPTEPAPTEPEEDSAIRSLKVYPMSIIEYTCGWWYREQGYYEYEWSSRVYYEVVMADGTYYEGTGGFEHNGEYYSTGCYNNQWENHWTAGNTYDVTFLLHNQTTQENWQCETTVTIEASPVESIVVNPLQMVEELDGWMNGEPGNEYFYYDWHNRINWTIFYKDGTSQSGTGTRVEYNGEEYYFSYEDPDQHLNHWTTGSYQIPMNFMGVQTVAEVEVIDTPIQDILVTPVEMMPGAEMYTDWDEQGRLYLRYNWLYRISYTVLFKDGSSCTGSEPYFSYNGRQYHMSYNDNQGFENMWTSGNTYTGQISVLNFTKDVPVTILESPIKNISLKPVLVYENSSGNMESFYPDGPDGAEQQYFRYNWTNRVEYDVEFVTGERWSGSGNGFSYRDQWFPFQGIDSQNGENPWTLGNTYNAEVAVAGMTMPITVTIAENPVRDIVFETIEIEEYTRGWWNGGPNGEYYYYGDWGSLMKFTVYFKDGSSTTGQGWGFYYNGRWCSFDSTWSYQNGENAWVEGNTYEGYVNAMGATYTVPITIYHVNRENGFTYLIQDGQAIINDCSLNTDTLEIPATLGGLPVVGITSLGNAVYSATTIRIPDSVTMLSENVFKPERWRSLPLNYLELGAGISQINVEMLSTAWDLQAITVAANNPTYTAVDGVLYTKDMKTMVVYPAGKQETHVIPDSVTNVDILFDNSDLYSGVKFELGAGVEGYTMEDGIIYNEDKTQIVKVTKDLVKDYVMPDTVTSIRSHAFANTGLTSVKISKNVREIAYAAFAGCTALKSVTIPEGVDSIEWYAFADCNSLEEVVLPNGLGWVGEVAFQNCSNLRSVTVPSTMQYFGHGAFGGCDNLEAVYAVSAERWMRINFGNNAANPLYFANNLYFQGNLVTELEIPNVITVIYDHAFAGFNISELTIPKQVFSIGDEAFYNANLRRVYLNDGLYEIGSSAFESTKLEMVYLPDTVDYVGDYAFAYCTALESVYLSTSLTAIENGTFTRTALQSITIPRRVEYIGNGAFADSSLRYLDLQCDSVTIGTRAFANCPLGDLEFGDNVTFMDERAFDGIDATTIKLPTSVTQLTYRVFGYCENLVSVTIPVSVTDIHRQAFEGSRNLNHVLYTGTEDQWWNVNCNSPEIWDAIIHFNATGDEVTTQMTCNKIIYTCSICNETRSIPRKDTAHEFVDGVCTICGQVGFWEYDVDPLRGNITINGYSNRTSELIIPSTIDGKTVTAIAPYAFADRTDLRTVVIPDTVTRVGEGAFDGCYNVHSVSLSKNLDRIAEYTFRDCSKLESIELPENVYVIDGGAFKGCNRLGMVSLNEGLNYIGSDAFRECWNLNELKLPSTVREISYYAFANTNIWELTVPASVQEIKCGAFENCYNMSSVYFLGNAIPMYDAFYETYADAYYPASNASWQNYNFDYAGRTMNWIAVEPAVFFVQPEDVLSLEAGEMTVNAVAKGSDITYQWFYAEAGSSDFRTSEQTGESFTMMMNGENSGVRVYCEVTDMLGQVTRSDIATLTVMEGGILGDLDGNLTVDVDDVLSLLLHVSMPEMFEISGPADFDKNGSVDVDDVVTLLLHVSMPDMFPLF